MKSNLSGYFSGVGAKRLAEVEIRPSVSNQHELNGIADFKKIFGSERMCFKGKFIYLPDNEDHIVECDGSLTWYDARENHPSCTEYCLYFTSNSAIEKARVDDLAVMCQTAVDKLIMVITPKDSTSESQLMWLFGLKEVGSNFIIKNITNEDKVLTFAGKYIISKLGINTFDSKIECLDDLAQRCRDGFTSTDEFSSFARSTIKGIFETSDSDMELITWMEREDLLFRIHEKHIVSQRLINGFKNSDSDIQEFLNFSLRLKINRELMYDFSLRNHISHIFDRYVFRYSKGVKTESNKKHDFLFPGIMEYSNSAFSDELLTILDIKANATVNWRQFLSESDRIQRKHLITIEPAINKILTDEMIAENLQLVVPKPIMCTYNDDQIKYLMSLDDFIQLVNEKQNRNYWSKDSHLK